MRIACSVVIDGHDPVVSTFAAVPRVGEMVYVLVDGDGEVFRVERVIHFAEGAIPDES